MIAQTIVLKTKYGMEKDKNKPLVDYQVLEYKMEPITPFGDYEPKTMKHRTKVCPQAAVAEMRPIVEAATNLDPWPESDYSRQHLLDCLDKIASGEVDDAKAHRWLGWIQGVLGARGNGSVSEYGKINKRSKR